jgi:hypothetical protein
MQVRQKDKQPLELLKREIKMTKNPIIILTILMSCVLSSPVYATLIDHHNGLIYDTDLNITWYNPNVGNMTWDQAMSWATGLTAGGVTGWRLPTAINRDGSLPVSGYNLAGSELGHLYYTELGNTGRPPGSSSGGLTNAGPFTNLQSVNYWTNTEWASFAGNAWAFSFISGLQGYADKNPNSTYIIYYSAMAVHDGNVGHTPIPGAILLFAPALVGLVVMRRKFFRSTGH